MLGNLIFLCFLFRLSQVPHADLVTKVDFEKIIGVLFHEILSCWIFVLVVMGAFISPHAWSWPHTLCPDCHLGPSGAGLL